MVETLNQIIEDGLSKKLLQNHTNIGYHSENGFVSIDDKEMANFGSCSYLGLENNQELKNGVIEAVQKYGTQFSSSRTYLSIGLYQELENLMESIFEKPLIVTASTTLGHLATIPIIVGKNDAVILDLQAHSSIQMTSQLLKAKQIPMHIIKHNCMDSLEAKIKEYNNKYDKIWYFADGVYSMYGDYAPFEKLEYLLDTYEKFHLYIDDAHGMGWTGENGCGVVRSKMKHHNKMILAVSLNKSFATAGGCIVFPNEEIEKKVRNCGSTYIFSGPIQPPMLGAAIASAQLHLSDDIILEQEKLLELIDFTNKRLDELNLPQFQKTESPLFFIPVGLPKICSEIISKMKDKGFFLNGAGFPAVPMRKSGIRFMVNNTLSIDLIDSMLTTLQSVYSECILENGSSFEKISKLFQIPTFEINTTNTPNNVKHQTDELSISIKHSIHDCDKEEWNEIFQNNGTLEYENISLVEQIFSKQKELENDWKFYYLTIKDNHNKVVIKTFITEAITKDDMFSPAYISEKVEEKRKSESPYFLTSKTVVTGSLITKGTHVFIDYSNELWEKALQKFSEYLVKIQENSNATKIMIRDFYGLQSKSFESKMLELGFIKFQLPNNMNISNLGWENTDQYLQSLSQKYRYNVRKEILKFEKDFVIEYNKANSEEELMEYYKLYENVYEKSFDLNVYKLPFSYFKAMNSSKNYDFVQLFLKNGEEKILVGVMFSHVFNKNYNALIVGLDYDYVFKNKTYKQIMYQTLKRAKELDCKKLDLAYTAELEKKKLGAEATEVFAYVQATEHFSHSILESL
ncbi:aminotransferase class I/II-fold pyridoxal phosphate-dependent enzyme [Aureivirga marina]|uniref:aminotransferase class I/II-fold pyridoxal phosphate-dependent enzyme n=1 Tax=Aureivirga marina TaxID=1182451 RepID=UPI0018C9930F|nr:aminotransferase class I/II-fold pyridoxal phosphate-dependent enzyme [Aureivirga marina]